MRKVFQVFYGEEWLGTVKDVELAEAFANTYKDMYPERADDVTFRLKTDFVQPPVAVKIKSKSDRISNNDIKTPEYMSCEAVLGSIRGSIVNKAKNPKFKKMMGADTPYTYENIQKYTFEYSKFASHVQRNDIEELQKVFNKAFRKIFPDGIDRV